MKIKLLLATLALTISAGAMANKTSDAISAAKSAKKEAAAVGFEWMFMGKMIKQAEAAVKKGNDKKALKLANKVISQGKAALKQAAIAKTAGPRF